MKFSFALIIFRSETRSVAHWNVMGVESRIHSDCIAFNVYDRIWHVCIQKLFFWTPNNMGWKVKYSLIISRCCLKQLLLMADLFSKTFKRFFCPMSRKSEAKQFTWECDTERVWLFQIIFNPRLDVEFYHFYSSVDSYPLNRILCFLIMLSTVVSCIG